MVSHWHCVFFCPWFDSPSGRTPPLWGFCITLRHTILGRTPLDVWSARGRDLYLTTHNNHKRQTFMPPGEFGTRNPSKAAAAGPRLRPRGMLWLVKPDMKQPVLQTLLCGYESVFVWCAVAWCVANTELCLWERHPSTVPPVVTERQRAEQLGTGCCNS